MNQELREKLELEIRSIAYHGANGNISAEDANTYYREGLENISILLGLHQAFIDGETQAVAEDETLAENC